MLSVTPVRLAVKAENEGYCVTMGALPLTSSVFRVGGVVNAESWPVVVRLMFSSIVV